MFALVGVPATVAVIGRSSAPPAVHRIGTVAAPVTGSAMEAAQPFLQATHTHPASDCRWNAADHSAILCTLKPNGSCEIEPKAGRGECSVPGKPSTTYLILVATGP